MPILHWLVIASPACHRQGRRCWACQAMLFVTATRELTCGGGCVSSAIIMLVEGCGQTNLGKNWGDGTAVDPKVVADYRIDSANDFFKQLIGKPYKSNVVVAPHVYPPSISKSTAENTVGPPAHCTGDWGLNVLDVRMMCLLCRPGLLS